MSGAAGCRSAKSAMRSRRLAAPRLIFCGSVTFRRTESQGSSAGLCGTRPIILAAQASAGVTPCTDTSPRSGCSSPATRRSSVDFPQPLGPMRLTKRPDGTVRWTSSRAVVADGPKP